METIITFAKENFDMISLIVGIAGIVVGIIGVWQAKKDKRKEIVKQIAEKQARLDVLSSKNHFFDSTTMNNTMIEREVLQKEIEELKKQL